MGDLCWATAQVPEVSCWYCTSTILDNTYLVHTLLVPQLWSGNNQRSIIFVCTSRNSKCVPPGIAIQLNCCLTQSFIHRYVRYLAGTVPVNYTRSIIASYSYKNTPEGAVHVPIVRPTRTGTCTSSYRFAYMGYVRSTVRFCAGTVASRLYPYVHTSYSGSHTRPTPGWYDYGKFDSYRQSAYL